MAKKLETILNCGNSHISANVFSVNGDELVLEQSLLETLHRDLTKDQIWMDSVIKAVENISQKIKGNVRVILPGSMLISKTIRVPHVEPEKQRKIVSFELSQKMPLPLSDLVWDYIVIDDDGVEEEILAFAVKPEIVEKFCDKLVKLGINPVQITPAPVLDYLAIRHVMGDMEAGNEALVINIGAKTTNLLFINQTGYLIRTIAIGGNTMSQSISDSLGITFEKAESLKKAYFSGEIKLAEDDASKTAISNANNQFLARASQEITRSVVTIKRLKKGQSPKTIYLTGRGAFLPGLNEYLQETQQINVQYFNPLIGLKISNNVPAEIHGLFPFILGEPIGMARFIFFESSNEQNKNLNLLPKDKIASIGIKKKTPILILSLLLFSVLPVPSALKSLNEIDQLNKKVEIQEKELKTLENTLTEQELKNTNLNFVSSLRSKIISWHQPFVHSLKTTSLSIELINFTQGILENDEIGDIWIDNFSLDASQELLRRDITEKSNVQNFRLFISGRYLVRPNLDGSPDKNIRDILIDLDRVKKEALTEYLSYTPHIHKIERKSFSIEGKGDLFNRYFSHFEYDILLKVK
jgi:type IV pilus assembly protein PilM